MKELSVEEKAKAYDEALKWMRDLYPNLGIAAKEKTESIFPELCESEDEKVRKALIEMVHDTTGDELWIDYNVHKEDALAWLKKQGKEDLPIQQAYEWGYTEGKRIERKHWVEKQKFSEDYNSIDPQFGKPIEQNPAWSEEDEEMFEYTISLLNYNLGCRKWLKSLKERYTWKPSSELDETSYQVGIKRVLENPESYGLTKYNWKPSDEQMNALSVAVKHGQTDDPDALKKLLEQLKKLKG